MEVARSHSRCQHVSRLLMINQPAEIQSYFMVEVSVDPKEEALDALSASRVYSLCRTSNRAEHMMFMLCKVLPSVDP